MDRVREFRKRAKECRRAASNAAPEIRTHYEGMADVWEKLAEERLTFFVEPAELEREDSNAETEISSS